MDRRRIFKSLAVTTAAIQDLVKDTNSTEFARSTGTHGLLEDLGLGSATTTEMDTERYTEVGQFKVGRRSREFYDDLTEIL